MKRPCMDKPNGYCPTTDQCQHRGICLADHDAVRSHTVDGVSAQEVERAERLKRAAEDMYVALKDSDSEGGKRMSKEVQSATTLNQDIDRLGETALRIADERTELLKALRNIVNAADIHGSRSDEYFDARCTAVTLLCRLQGAK